ncbi:hypothetical protein XH97_34160 [Bradyrhizobium sp. CCBAU 53380]|nr:hypothetical protein [Bradyrhizobium sp. CCBAU 53380]
MSQCAQETLNSIVALADEQRQLTRLPHIINSGPAVIVAKQHLLSSPAGCQLDAMAIHVREHVRDGTDILARLRHHRSEDFPNIRGVAMTFRERLHLALAPYLTFVPRTGIHLRATQWMPQQARSYDMTGFVNPDSPVLLLGTAERGEKIVVRIVLHIAVGAAAVVGGTADLGSGGRPDQGSRRTRLALLGGSFRHGQAPCCAARSCGHGSWPPSCCPPSQPERSARQRPSGPGPGHWDRQPSH